MSKTIEIGPYSAYAIAVKYGYVGTEEDWIKSVEAARKSAETSAANAKREADGASASAAIATEQAGIATAKAGESAASADASASSASAAATSEANAKKYSEEAGAKANTDKTLTIENAPADAKAVGDIILDRTKETPQPIFYSKAEVEAKIKEILAAQREEDLARIKYWASDDPTSPASFIGGTWERIEDCTIWGASDKHPAGTTVEAGLPSIYGQLNGVLFSSDKPNASGILSVTLANGYILTKGSSSGNVSIYANNIRTDGSPIYGASNTVQPPAYCTYIWRRVA